MKKKAVFFDIDGTLFDKHIGIPESAKQGVYELKKNGHIPVICTGRTISYLDGELKEMGFESIIAGAGTYVEHQGAVLECRYMDRSLLEKAMQIIEEYQVKYIMEGLDALYYNEAEKDEEYNSRIEKMSSVASFIPYHVERDKVHKFSCYLDERNQEGAARELRKYFDVILHENMPFAEILPKGCTKASGIKRILAELKVDVEDTYAFGDSNNDLEMLSFVKYGIAMGNACKSVLDAARYKTNSLKEHGIYNGLKQFNLI